ncbi:alpha/beta fold hydrolase [Oscillatoria sp. CS-180]|uniref:thioesterase II family protein n=1 Tax=Oscillatoria sp. CS-180 TaxID=3021720 RepID=UPI00232F9243|nr:alpha/beta fold hydrolase [Oscillatoria sp. CS-180]MDB9525389.1 alpha/beta fold hydrolase [Oscillatoria sp. CS-180]
MQTPWLKSFNTSAKATSRLFCFPYAGGSSQIFRTWPKYLPDEIEVVAVELPGRGSRFREAPFTDLVALVQALLDVLPPYLDKPFAFFGHSMGGLIAFELAQQMQRSPNRPFHLIVSGHAAPQNPPVRPPIHDLPKVEFIEQIRQLNGTPSELLDSQEFQQLFLPVLRSDFTLLETYQYLPNRSPLEIPLTVLGGLQDPDVSCDDLQDWQTQTQKEFSAILFTGDHFFINAVQQDVLETLAEILRPALAMGRSQ